MLHKSKMNPFDFTKKKPVLYYSLRSPFARRVRLALAHLKIEYQPKEISVFEPPAEFLKMQPLGLVPFLQVGDLALADSSAILEFLDQATEQGLWPKTDFEQKARARSYSTLAAGVMQYVVQYYLETLKKDPYPGSPIELEEFETRIGETLIALEKAVDEHRELFVRGGVVSQVGFDLCVALQYLQLRLPHFETSEKNKIRPESFAFILDLAMRDSEFVKTIPPR
jgi:glutathione S-transferase